MGFRDDGEAARARADALARELAERDAQIETLKAELERKRAKLHEVKEEASPVVESAENTERALQALEALKAKNAEHARMREAKTDAEKTAQDRTRAQGREKRLLRSLSLAADVDVFGLLPFALVLTVWGLLYFGISGRPLYAALVPVGLGLGLLAIKFYARDWARRVARREEEWVRSLPYALDGYPAALAIKPASGSSTFHKLDGDEHRILSVELELADGTVPADLGAIMTGFDPELDTSNPLARGRRWAFPDEAQIVESPNILLRLSPVTKTESGTTAEDHNRAVRDWVRRFEREVLRPLHARHPLARVTVRLR